MRSSTSVGMPSAAGVPIMPGRTAFAVIPHRTFSAATVRTMPTSPAFDAA
jgi:hypothetical protein